MLTAYEFLNVKERASVEEIEAAARKVGFLYHPDKHPDLVLVEGKFKLVQEAKTDCIKGNKERRYPVLEHYQPVMYAKCKQRRCAGIIGDSDMICEHCLAPVSERKDFDARREAWKVMRAISLGRNSEIMHAILAYEKAYGSRPKTRGRDLVE